MRRSISWMIGYDDYYNKRSFDKTSGWDEEEWKLGFAYARDEDYKHSRIFEHP